MVRSVLKFLLLLVAVVTVSGCITNRSFTSGREDVSGDVAMKAKLLRDRQYNYSDVDVTLFEGRLLLTGNMANSEGIRYLEGLAQDTNNVHDVINEVLVGPKTTFRAGAADAVIDQKVLAALVTDPNVITANYKIAVSNGVVHLLGVAQGPQELKRATDHARQVAGVKKVVSHVLFLNDPRRTRMLP